jgi:hypothetical protein
MSKEQKRDKERLKDLHGKIKGTKFVRVRVAVTQPDDLTPDAKDLTSFPSEFAVLRRDEHDNLGYRIPRLVPGPNGEAVRMPEMRGRKKGEKNGVKKLGTKKPGEGNEKMPIAYTSIVPGQPDFDAGVDGWIQPSDTQDFVRRGNRMDSLLETFNRTSDRIVYEKDDDGKFVRDDKGQRVVLKRIPHVKTFRGESSMLETLVDAEGNKKTFAVKTNAETLSNRDMIGLSPYLSRALQRMTEDGCLLEGRQVLEAIMEPLGRFYEATYRGPETHAKLTSMVLHLDSEHAHYDVWRHETYLSTAATGVGEAVVPVRLWDAKAGCHYGPGPGVMFWMRHFDVLDDLQELGKTEPEAAQRAGYTKMLCEQAVAGCRRRAADSNKEAVAEKLAVEAKGGTYTKWIRPADDYARDIRVSREADRLLAQAIRDLGLERDYVSIGMAEYKAHLIEAYKSGETGIKMETPEDLAQVAKVAERAEKRAREEREAAEKALLEVIAEKEAVERLRDEAVALRADLDIDAAAAKAALTAAEKAQRDAETALARAEDAAQKQVEPILADAEKAVSEAELNGVRRLFSRFFPDRAPAGKSVEKIVEEIQKDVLATAEQTAAPILANARALEDRAVQREQRVFGSRALLAVKVRGWRKTIRDCVDDLVDKKFGKKITMALGGFVDQVLGKEDARWFRQAGRSPIKAMLNEFYRGRKAELALRDIVQNVTAKDPKGPAAMALAAGKSVIAANDAARKQPPGSGVPTHS